MLTSMADFSAVKSPSSELSDGDLPGVILSVGESAMMNQPIASCSVGNYSMSSCSVVICLSVNRPVASYPEVNRPLVW